MTDITIDDLSFLAKGYCEALLDNESNGDNCEDWKGIGPDDFSQDALRQIAEDCRLFVEVARLEPQGDGGGDYLAEIDDWDLGQYFFLERQCTGVGFADCLEGELRDRLIEAVNQFDEVTVSVGEDRLIRVSAREPMTTPTDTTELK